MAIFDVMPDIPEIALPRLAGKPEMMMIEDMRMAPDLRVGDFVMISPVDRFQYDSLYVLEELEVMSVWQCQHIGGGQISIRSRERRQRPRIVSHEEFKAMVVAIVGMTCRVLDPRIMGEVRH